MEKTINCIAWDLVGKYSELVDTTHKIKVGRTFWYSAATTRNGLVRIQRIVAGKSSDKLHIATKYLHPDCPVQLVPLVPIERDK
jgi:hypothetical protein